MILKSFTIENGALTTVHVISQIQMKYPFNVAQIEVRSYASEEAYVGGLGNLWTTRLSVPVGDHSGVVSQVQSWLISSGESPFAGGLITEDTSGTLQGNKDRKIAEINAACSAQIIAGFTSEALGVPHHYPAKKQDQDNLVASVADSLIPGLEENWVTPFWCEVGGLWAYRMHTVTQIQRVGRDGKMAIVSALMRNEELCQQVLAALQLSELETINW